MRCRYAYGLASALMAALLWAAPAQAGVVVNFAGRTLNPDGKLRDAWVAHEIKADLNRLGARYLDSRDRLRITILDIDRAGFDMSSRGPSRIRVLNGATWPKIRLRYRLERNHKIVAAGEEMLSDQYYLAHPGAGLSTDALRYEKAMLADWFREKFGAGQTSGR